MWSHVSKHRDGQSEKERQTWVGWCGRAYSSLLITQNWEEWLISPRTPWQNGKMVWQELHKVQQREVQNPASGEKQSQAPVYAGDSQLQSISPMQEGWKSWDHSEWRKGSYGGNLPVCINTWKEDARRMKPGTSHPCPVTGLEITSTNWNTGGSPQTSTNTFSL